MKTMKSPSKITLVANLKTSEKLIESLSGVFPDHKVKLSKIKDSSPLGMNLELSKKVEGRSRPQENYYRKWVRHFAEFCGLLEDEMHHELLCKAFGSTTTSTKFGDKTRANKRSADVDPKEYSSLIETLIIVAAEMSFAVPPPPTPEEYEEYANG